MNKNELFTVIKRNLSLQFLGYASLLYLIPIFLVGMVAYQIAYVTIVEEAKQANAQIVVNQSDYLDLQMSQLNNLATNIAGIETITNAFNSEKFKNMDSYNSLKTQAEIGTILNGYANIDGLISIEIFTMDGRHYHVGDTLDANVIDETTKQKLLDSALSNPQQINWQGVEKNVNLKSTQKQVVTTTMLLRKVDKNTFVPQPVALLVINTSLQEFQSHFSKINLGQDAYLLIIDSNNEIIYAPDSNLWGSRLSQETIDLLQKNDFKPFNQLIQQEKMLVTPRQSSLTGWTVLSFVPYRIFVQKTTPLALTIAFSLLICLGLLTIWLLLINKRIISPIKIITTRFQSLQTGDVDWTERLTVSQENEIGELFKWYNVFMDNTVSAQLLQKSEERYKLASLASNDGLWDWDLANPENNFISPRFLETLGYQKGDYSTRIEDWLAHVHPEDLQNLKNDFDLFINSNTQIFSNEHRLRCKNGEYRWFACRGIALREKDAQGQPTGKAYRIAGAHTDINDRKKAENELRHRAFHDTLTGLPNRILFQDRLERSYQRLQRNNDYRFAVLFLDFDRFKDINDTLGHDTGDCLLLEIASRLKDTLREIDTIARFGGDEFVLLLEEVQNTETAELLAERILRSLEKPFEINEYVINISASIGVVISNLQQHVRPEDLIRDADIAMYQAKANGRACYEVFDTEMREELLSRAVLETDLRRAIQEQEFSLVYQPILSLSDNQIEGFEALIRWQTNDKNFIAPEKFIPLAEETGLIIPIGRWVIEEACRQMHIWQQQGVSGSMNVNLSGVQLAQANVVEMIEGILIKTELPPHLLHIEITESALIKDIETAIAKLKQLKSLGINIHMDDFGTGYSSLSQLRLLPVDTIKIDRSFIRNLDNNKNDLGLVRAIISMATELKLNVIAEGIENEAQRELLQGLNCGYGQGYFLCRPRLGKEMAEVLFEEK